MAGKQKEVHRLEDLLVEEVSIVDRPANQRRFLTIKNEDAMGEQVAMNENGELVTSGGDVSPTSSDDSVSSAVELGDDFAKAGQALTEVQKKLTIPSEMRSEIFRSIGDSVRRLHTVMNAADIAQTDEKGGDSTLVPVLMAELKEISTAIGTAVKRLGNVAKSDAEDSSNDSLDASPATGSVSMEDALANAVSAVESVIEKRNMSKGRLGKFKQALGALQTILSELEGKSSGDPAKAAAAADKGDDVKKDDVVTMTKADFEKLGSYMERIIKTVHTQGELIQQLRSARPVSNAIPVEKSSVPVDEGIAWPLDMNAERSKDKVDKAISFHE